MTQQLRINLICKECDRDVLFFMSEEAQEALPEYFMAGCSVCKQDVILHRDGGLQTVRFDKLS